jgi:perosamine synthetase
VTEVQDKREAGQLAMLGGERAVVTEHPREWPVWSEEAAAKVRDLVLSGRTFDYGRGPEIAAFEDAFAAYHGGGQALMVNSGTSALYSAFFGAGIGPGDEVLCPTATFLATVTPLFQLGAVPVLCDADPETGNLDPADAAKRVTARTKAIVVTHLWGHPVEMDAVTALCAEHGLALIEDCSHAHGATYRGRLVGTFGSVAAFSTGSGKMVSGGMAGVVLTRDQVIYDRATLLGHFRKRSRETVRTPFYKQFTNTGYGANLRVSPMAAVLAHDHLSRLDDLIAKKTENLQRLTRGLADVPGFVPPATRPHVTRGAWYGYKVGIDMSAAGRATIAEIVAALKAEGCDIDPPGSPPLHTTALFQEADNGILGERDARPGRPPWRRYRNGELPVSEQIQRTSLSFPAARFYGEVGTLAEEYVLACRKVSEHFGFETPPRA